MSDLKGKRILVVEDEPLIAMVLEDILEEIGCIVAGAAHDIARAEALARGEVIDAAILDVNIGGRTSHPVAEILSARGVPFLVASGYGDVGLLPGASLMLGKPFRPEEVMAALRRLFA